jgi:hypothetical protein
MWLIDICDEPWLGYGGACGASRMVSDKSGPTGPGKYKKPVPGPQFCAS